MRELYKVLFKGLLFITPFIVIIVLWNRLGTLKCDNERLLNNQQLLITSYDSINACYQGKVSEVRALNLTISELREQLPELKGQLDYMNAKYKQVSSINISKQQSSIKFIPDTVWIYSDFIEDSFNLRDSIKQFRYNDPWIKFTMDSIVNINVYDTVVCVSHYKQKRFLWWTWDKKSYVSIMHTNPYVSAVETFINLKQ